jgi:hypothetical protein
MDRSEFLTKADAIVNFVRQELSGRLAELADDVVPKAEPPLPEKCPKCGSGRTGDSGVVQFGCDSQWLREANRLHQVPSCRISELEQIVETLRAALQKIREKGAIVCDSPLFFRTLADNALRAAAKREG